MIIVVLGGIGSGKSLSVVKEIIDNQQFALTNFRIKNYKDTHRIKVSDIIMKDADGKLTVNWAYWEAMRKKHKSYSIYLDEIHNIIHARRSMSRMNIQMSKWVSQIRKILADSPNNHLYLISQTKRKIDVDFRDLAQIVIVCQCFKIRGKTVVKQMWYDGMEAFDIGRKKFTTVYTGNKYFKYFNTDEMVTFSDAEDYL